MTIAPEGERLPKATVWRRPRNSSSAELESSSRGSERSSNMRRTLRGIIEPLSMTILCPLAFAIIG
jgi:hypothetical protein